MRWGVRINQDDCNYLYAEIDNLKMKVNISSLFIYLVKTPLKTKELISSYKHTVN